MAAALSVIVPVYNENATIRAILEMIHAVPVDKEIIVVDDGSSDGTRELLREHFEGRPDFKIMFHEKNQGKGRAIRTGIGAATGEALIIQDADLEYDPMDYLPLLSRLKEGPARVVYGSRFLNKRRVTAPWHRFVNYVLTLLTNILYGSKLTDMETCYKLFKCEVIRKLDLVSDGFEIEVELTVRALKSGEQIVEEAISYRGRSFHEGKKLGWTDGVKAVWALIYYRLGGS